MNQAAFTPHKVPYHGRILLLEIGEIATSERQLATRWGWNRRTVGKFISMLENERMIYTTEWATKWARLKLNNYADLQDKLDKNTPQDAPDNAPEDAPHSAPHSAPQPTRKAAQREPEEPPIIKGNKGKRNNTPTPAKAGEEKTTLKASKQTSPQSRELVTYLSDGFKQRGAREGQFSKPWFFAGLKAADNLLKTFSLQEVKAAIDYLLDHRFHGTSITSMAHISSKIIIWQRETGGHTAKPENDNSDPMARGCK